MHCARLTIQQRPEHVPAAHCSLSITMIPIELSWTDALSNIVEYSLDSLTSSIMNETLQQYCNLHRQKLVGQCENESGTYPNVIYALIF